MKLPHVVGLSILGMVLSSLSVLVFTSSRNASRDDLTSNDDALTSNEQDSTVAPTASTTPRVILAVEQDATASSPVPKTTPKKHAKHEPTGWLQLVAVEKPCAFFLDGKPITLQNDVPLFVRTGPHKVRCERQGGDTIERQINVGEEVINPEFF